MLFLCVRYQFKYALFSRRQRQISLILVHQLLQFLSIFSAHIIDVWLWHGSLQVRLQYTNFFRRRVLDRIVNDFLHGHHEVLETVRRV